MAKLSLHGILILGIIILIVVGYICYKYVISPQLRYLHAVRRQLVSERNLLQTRRQKAEAIALLQKKNATMRSELASIQNRLFSDATANDFLRSLPKLTEETNNNLTYVKFLDQEVIPIGDALRYSSKGTVSGGKTKHFAKLPVQLTVQGRYANIVRLLDRIDQYERMIDIVNLKIDADENTLPAINLRLTIVLYIDQSNT